MKHVQRVLSGILTAAMLLTLLVSGSPVFVRTAAAAEAPGQAETAQPALDGSSEFKLQIHHIIPDKNDTFTATLTDAKAGKTFTVPMSSTHEGKITEGALSGIPDGTYTLTVKAVSYLTYEQELTFKEECLTVTLYNDDNVNQGREMDKRFGVITVGDLNMDNDVNDTDADMLRDVIEAGSYVAAYDLNADNKVDLVDLAYVVRNHSGNVQAKAVSSASSVVLKSVAQAAVSEETKASVQGADSVAEAILSHGTDTYVSLTPQNEGAISQENPVEMSLDLQSKAGTDTDKPKIEAEAVTIAPPANAASTITQGTVDITTVDEDGTEVIYQAVVNENPVKTAYVRQEVVQTADGQVRRVLKASGSPMAAAPAATSTTSQAKEVSVESDGTIVINLGKKVAIKKVSIRVTGTSNGSSLASIASVEFLGDFASRIPEPDLSIPTILSASNTEGEYKTLTFNWTPQTNVTGYEVSIYGPGLSVVRSVASADGNQYSFISDSFNGSVKAFETYELRVRSVNGSWRSDWSEPYSYTITCTQLPQRPEYLDAKGEVLSINVSWRALYDTQSWNLYYRARGETVYTEVAGLTSPTYRISNLIGGTQYEIYVVGVNKNGTSPASNSVVAAALTPEGVRLPKYGLINRDGNLNLSADHIQSIDGNRDKGYTVYRADGSSVTNTEAVPADWLAIVDNNPASYVVIQDWDSGVVYGNFRGPKITLTEAHKIGSLRIAPSEATVHNISRVQIGYRDEQGAIQKMTTSLSTKYDSQNRKYYEVILDKPLTVDYLEVYTTTDYGPSQPYSIAEIGIYEYDSLMDDVRALFTDETEIELRPEVTAEDIEALRTRLNTPDPDTGEIHPREAVIKQLLDYAVQVLNETALDNPITLDTTVTRNQDGHLGIAQTLSDNQPLGYVAAAGETLVVYVGSSTESLGARASLQFTVTQYHPEVSKWSQDVRQLVVGRNEITIPTLISAQKERGGSVYIWYGSDPGAKTYTIRVKGGHRIPMLNVDGLIGQDRTDAIEAYVSELEDYVPTIETLHNELHQGSSNANVNYPYKAEECFLNSTEIVMENMFFSFPASQVLAGLGTDATHEQRIAALTNAIEAMEQEVKLFYQFKGLNEAATDTDRYPNTRLNIRYHQMFTGAFMYAGGKHIGIEWGSVPGLFGTTPVVTDGNGKKTSGNYSGWGIAHEIGHCINAAGYQRVEVTNNIFAQLAQTDETNTTFRTTYDKVYKAVAAGNTGHTGDLAVQLAMYWQLHLAYDNNYSYKFYSTAAEQQSALFYARVDSYFRSTAKADAAVKAADIPAGAKAAKEPLLNLVLNDTADQNFMRVCCAAALHDVLDFFRAWGFTPNEATVAYASNFPKETRDIQFIDDDSRLYRLEGGLGMSGGTAVTATIDNAVDSRINGQEVKISLGNNNDETARPDAMLGYEIFRNGTLVAFVPATAREYTDIVATENNKAFVYTVIGVDRLLNETAPVNISEVKVSHKGAISKADWTAETNMKSADDKEIIADAKNGYCENTYESAITKAIDGESGTVYTGATETVNGKTPDAEIIINLGATERVTALEYTWGGAHPIGSFEIYVGTDTENWTLVKTGTFANTGEAAETVWFNELKEDGQMDPWMHIYDASFVKIVAVGQKEVSLAELSILGPTGDNVELTQGGIGTLSEAFVYEEGEDGSTQSIPAGSVVFHGNFKGDPSYNVVVLKDQNGNIIDGDQIILAKVTDKGNLGETSDGTFLFWLANNEDIKTITSVQAELYRVTDARTLEGDRITSTSLHVTVPVELKPVEIKSDATTQKPADPSADAGDPGSGAAGARMAGSVLQMAPARNWSGLVLAAPASNAAAASVMALSSESALDQPVKVSFDPETYILTIQLSASEEPIAMHVAISMTGSSAGSITNTFDWNNNTDSVYFATVFSGGTLDLYVVSRESVLGSSSSSKIDNTEVVTGTLNLSAIKEQGFQLSVTAGDVDYVSQVYSSYTHPSNLNENLSVGRPGSTSGPCQHTRKETKTEEATCMKPGYIEVKCLDCGETLSVSALPVLGHDFANGVCTRCGEKSSDVVVITVKEDLTYDAAPVTCAQSDADITFTCGRTNETYTVKWYADIDGRLGAELSSAPVNAGTYWVGVTPNGLGAETMKQFTIAPTSEYTFTAPTGRTGYVNYAYPSLENYTATGISGETIQGTLTWYTDEACTVPAAGGRFTEVGTTTLYCAFLPAAGETNYAQTAKTGSTEFTVSTMIVVPPEPEEPTVSTEKNTEGETTVTETAVRPDAAVQNGTAKASVSSSVGSKLVQQAESNGSSAVVIAPANVGSADRVEVSLPGSTAAALAEKTEADLRVETPAADVTIPNAALEDLGSGTTTITVAVETQEDNTIAVEVLADGKAVDHFAQSVKLEIPSSSVGSGTVAVLVKEDGTREVIRTSLADAEAGVVYAAIDGSATLEIVDNSKTFADVDPAEWYGPFVNFAASHELMNGTGPSQFGPKDTITRGTIAMILYHVEHDPDAAGVPFPDTEAGAWYTDAVTWAASNNIVGGYSDGTFGPEDNITREQMAVFLYNYAKGKGLVSAVSEDSLDSFTDADKVAGWSLDAMRWAAQEHIINGSNGQVNPSGTASRAEAATILMNFCQFLSK